MFSETEVTEIYCMADDIENAGSSSLIDNKKGDYRSNRLS